MSNLMRERRGRDLWISRSHLYAYGVGVLALVGLAFGVGVWVGERRVEHPTVALSSLAEQTPDGELVELLARVDAAAAPDGGVHELTFPDALAGRGGAPSLVPAEEPSSTLRVEGDGVVPPERGDVPPRGEWTLTAASVPERSEAERIAASLRERKFEAWVAPERLDGETRYRVGVGGWRTRAEAERALEAMGDAISIDGAPVIVTRY